MNTLPSRATLGASVVFALLSGCGSGDDPTLPDFDAHPVTVTPAVQWAGAPVTLSSAAFEAWPDEDMVLLIGDAALVTAHRTGDSTFTALLPDTLPGGHYLLRAAVIEYPNFEAGLDVAGWTDTRSVAIAGTSSFSVGWPAGGPTGLLLVKDDTIRFVRAVDGALITFPARTTTWRIPPGLAADGRLLAPLNDDTLLAWTFNAGLGSAAATDTFAMTVFPDNGYYRFANGGWLITDHNTLNFAPGALKDISYVTAPRAVVSAAAGRVVVPYRQMTVDPGGIPVFGTDSGTIKSIVAGYSRLDAATFNAAGTVLYLAASLSVAEAGTFLAPQSLLKVDALTGAVLDSVAAIPEPRVEDFFLDEANGWLFEAVRDSAQWTLRVRDAETLDLVALLRSPHMTDRCPAEGELHLLPASAAGVMFLGSASCFTPGADVGFARFTLK